jgi:hypothetical protein
VADADGVAVTVADAVGCGVAEELEPPAWPVGETEGLVAAAAEDVGWFVSKKVAAIPPAARMRTASKAAQTQRDRLAADCRFGSACAVPAELSRVGE